MGSTFMWEEDVVHHIYQIISHIIYKLYFSIISLHNKSLVQIIRTFHLSLKESYAFLENALVSKILEAEHDCSPSKFQVPKDNEPNKTASIIHVADKTKSTSKEQGFIG